MMHPSDPENLPKQSEVNMTSLYLVFFVCIKNGFFYAQVWATKHSQHNVEIDMVIYKISVSTIVVARLYVWRGKECHDAAVPPG